MAYLSPFYRSQCTLAIFIVLFCWKMKIVKCSLLYFVERRKWSNLYYFILLAKNGIPVQQNSVWYQTNLNFPFKQTEFPLQFERKQKLKRNRNRTVTEIGFLCDIIAAEDRTTNADKVSTQIHAHKQNKRSNKCNSASPFPSYTKGKNEAVNSITIWYSNLYYLID